MLSIRPCDVHVWLVACDESHDHALAQYEEVLSAEEKKRYQLLNFPAYRHQYLVTRSSVRRVLSRYSNTEPFEWRFGQNRFGRPYICSDDRFERSLSFNISHTQGIVAIGVTRGSRIGVDVENCLTFGGSTDLARRFFTVEEAADLVGVSGQERVERFLEYWTLKESYIKFLGAGLSVSLNSFRFSFGGADRSKINFGSGEIQEGRHCRFWSIRPFPEYIVAICSEGIGSIQQVVLREFIPPDRERGIECKVARHS
jgi:4'-phosphopantetheinyl transferase